MLVSAELSRRQQYRSQDEATEETQQWRQVRAWPVVWYAAYWSGADSS